MSFNIGLSGLYAANKAVLAAATTITVTNQPNIVVQPDSGWVQ